MKEKVLDGQKEGIQARFWSDYKAQELFMQGMQACMGDEFDPRVSKQEREANGDFGKNKNDVPQNILTVKYILHAYDISYTTFKRMKKADKDLPKTKAAHPSKGQSIFDSKTFAQKWYSPYRIYIRLKYAEWMQTEVGRNADKNRKRVSYVFSLFLNRNHTPNLHLMLYTSPSSCFEIVPRLLLTNLMLRN